jgi:IS30 family transposase
LTGGTVLCIEEREEVSRGIVADEPGREIARRLGRHYSVVNREIARNGGRPVSRASEAHRNAAVSAKRPKRKAESDPLLLADVTKGLVLKWSPQQISVRMKRDFPDNEAMRVSPETVYQALFVPAKGQLTAQLVGRRRTGKTRRVNRAEHRAVTENKQAIPNMVMITERDLIMGKANSSAIATLVEEQADS